MDRAPNPVDGARSPANAEVRALTADDAESYARLFIDIWRETYAGLMPDERLAALEVAPVTARMRVFFDDPANPPTIGAFGGGDLLGWARAGTPRDDDAPHAVELWSLNVASAARGSGLAVRLMEHALAGRSAYLWVVEGNARALRFYERQGFRADGVTRWEPTDRTHELRMVRA